VSLSAACWSANQPQTRLPLVQLAACTLPSRSALPPATGSLLCTCSS
jgi:hypothetical protein